MLKPAFRAPAAYEWRSAMEGHARERGRRGEAVEPAVGSCPDVEGVRHQGEHLFVGVIAGSKELPFGLMSAPPCAERRECCPIKADNFVGVVALAACFVPLACCLGLNCR